MLFRFSVDAKNNYNFRSVSVKSFQFSIFTWQNDCNLLLKLLNIEWTADRETERHGKWPLIRWCLVIPKRYCPKRYWRILTFIFLLFSLTFRIAKILIFIWTLCFWSGRLFSAAFDRFALYVCLSDNRMCSYHFENKLI